MKNLNSFKRSLPCNTFSGCPEYWAANFILHLLLHFPCHKLSQVVIKLKKKSKFNSKGTSRISGRPELNTLYTLVHQYFSASRTSLTIQHSYICHLTLSLIYPQRHIYNSYFFIFPKNSQTEYQNFTESHFQF